MSETGAGMPYQPPQKQRAPGAGPAGPKDDQPGHGDGSGTNTPSRASAPWQAPATAQAGDPQRAAAPGQTPAPYGTGDNRRQYGTMPMRGSVGTPPGMGGGRGGYQPPTYGGPGSGSAGLPNMPGRGNPRRRYDTAPGGGPALPPPTPPAGSNQRGRWDEMNRPDNWKPVVELTQLPRMGGGRGGYQMPMYVDPEAGSTVPPGPGKPKVGLFGTGSGSAGGNISV